MKVQIRSPGRALGRLLSLCVGMAMLVAAAQAVTWTVYISPADGGDVSWSTTSPVKSGVLLKSGSLTFNSGSFVDLTFTPAAGYSLKTVYKNAEDWTPWLDASHHFQFGPVTKTHVIVSIYAPIIPTGNVGLTFPANNPNLTAIVDVTGTYTGVSPTHYHRPYNITVAMDPEGKLTAIGTVSGIVPKTGDPIMASAAAVDTIAAQPVAHGTGRFVGVRDGVDGTCNASGRGPVVLQTLTNGQTGVAGTGSYNGVLAGVPYRERNVPLEVPATLAQQANLSKTWGLMMNFSKKIDPKTHREYIAAVANLTRPDHNTIVFPERRVRYTVKYGYTVSLTRGTNVTMVPPTLDRKTSVLVKRMTMVQQGGVWSPTGGTVRYRFLGQRGLANLMDFLH